MRHMADDRCRDPNDPADCECTEKNRHVLSFSISLPRLFACWEQPVLPEQSKFIGHALPTCACRHYRCAFHNGLWRSQLMLKTDWNDVGFRVREGMSVGVGRLEPRANKIFCRQ